jgi:hypothetical protein
MKKIFEVPVLLFAFVFLISIFGMIGYAATPSLTNTPGPVLIAPVNTTVSGVPTFSWNSVSGATSYRLQVTKSNDPSYSKPIVSKNVSTTSYKPALSSLAAGSYIWEVRAKNSRSSGNWSTSAFTAGSSQTSDTQAPSAPTNLAATTQSSSQISLSWSASSDDVGVTGYKIFRNGTQVGTVNATTYLDTGLSAATTYSYTVAAYDAAGNSSSQSSAKSATTQAQTSAAKPGIIIPLYIYPGATWDTVISTKNAYPNVPIRAIINPNSGPGTTADSTYASKITQLRTANVSVLGYVYTSYGARTLSAVQADIDKYKTFYPNIDGIFLDEQSATAGQESYYATLTNYAKSKGFSFTVGNPGTSSVSPTYLNSVDTVLIYENSGTPDLAAFQSWTSYPRQQLGMIPYNVSSYPGSWVSSASVIAGWIYVTNDILPNPWDTVSPYMTNLAMSLNSSGTADTQAPSVPTGLTASPQSSSQIALSWNSSSDNTGVTGYKIFRNGTQVGTVTATTYTDAGLAASTAYSYTIAAYDAAGNNSSQSNAVSATTAAAQTSSTVWVPAQNTTWQWQLSGTINQAVPASTITNTGTPQMFDIDLFDNTASTISSLHAKGSKVICYFSAGAYENWRPDASSFPASVLGNSNGWPGEKWLDIRNITALGPIMQARLDLAVSKGCDGVEPDNIDGYTNSTGFPLTGANQITFNKWLASEAHKRGLSIGLKNDIDQVVALQPYFDWALNEQCFQYNECDTLTPFITAGKAVFTVEYSLQTSAFCPQSKTLKFMSMKRDLDLTGTGTRATCW